MSIPLLLALGSGSVSTVNPCGFAMLPAFVSYYLGEEEAEDVSTVRRVRRALVVAGGYGLASLGCTLPVFLVVVAGALSTNGFLPGLVMFLAYAAGMGAVLLGVTLATALGKGVIVRWFKRTVPYVELVSGLGLLVAGGYLVYREIAFLRFTGWT